jgi:hypothetical protein
MLPFLDSALRNAAWLLGAGVSGLLVGCMDLGKTGNLNQGTFTYQCRGGADPGCFEDGAPPKAFDFSIRSERPFPAAIAESTRFGVRFSPKIGSDAVSPSADLDVQSASPSALQASPATDGTVFVAMREGTHAIYVQESPTTILDFTKLRVVRPSALLFSTRTLTRSVSGESVTVAVGEPAEVFVYAANEQRAPLAGLVTAQWSNDAAEVAVIGGDRPEGAAQISFAGGRDGVAKLTASVGELSATFTVVVGTGGTPPPDGDAGTDGGVDSGSADGGTDGGAS